MVPVIVAQPAISDAEYDGVVGNYCRKLWYQCGEIFPEVGPRVRRWGLLVGDGNCQGGTLAAQPLVVVKSDRPCGKLKPAGAIPVGGETAWPAWGMYLAYCVATTRATACEAGSNAVTASESSYLFSSAEKDFMVMSACFLASARYAWNISSPVIWRSWCI